MSVKERFPPVVLILVMEPPPYIEYELIGDTTVDL